LRAAIGLYNSDVIVAHGSEPFKYLVPAMLGTRTRLVYYVIGTYAGDPDQRLQLKVWRALARHADVVATCGEDVRDECEALLGVPPGRLSVVFNGRDPDLFHPGPPAPPGRDPLVVFLGALIPGKRPDRFVEVVSALRAQGMRLRAQIIGDGPMRSVLEEPARAAGVELLGARTDVAALLGTTDLLVFPSLPAGEGIPGVLIEAGLCGVPVVATAVPGVRTVVKDGETGFVVGIDDPDAMISGTASLLGDDGSRTQMGRAARERCVDRFSIASVATQWSTLLRPLLDGRHRTRRR